MAAASFKSTTNRTPVGSNSEDSGKSVRRSRSLSQFSRQLSPEETPDYIKNAAKGKFVNTIRGSATLPEISPDDLALDRFSNENQSDWSSDRDRQRRRSVEEIRRWASDTASSYRRRGRSVSRRLGDGGKSVASKGTSRKNVNSADAGSRRRRSLSVVRYQNSDAERSSDRSGMSTRLAEEDEKFSEYFISNVEHTDISSFDGERSDGSSCLGSTRARNFTVREAKSCQSPAASSRPVEMEGVVLPWLQWETSHDCSLLGKDKMQNADMHFSLDSKKEMNLLQAQSSHSTSTHESWILQFTRYPLSLREGGGKSRHYSDSQLQNFDMEEHVKLLSDDELLFDMHKERRRIRAGGLLLCTSHP